MGSFVFVKNAKKRNHDGGEAVPLKNWFFFFLFFIIIIPLDV